MKEVKFMSINTLMNRVKNKYDRFSNKKVDKKTIKKLLVEMKSVNLIDLRTFLVTYD